MNIELLLPEVEHGAVLGAALLGARACLLDDRYEQLKDSVKSSYTRILPDEKLVKYYSENTQNGRNCIPKSKSDM